MRDHDWIMKILDKCESTLSGDFILDSTLSYTKNRFSDDLSTRLKKRRKKNIHIPPYDIIKIEDNVCKLIQNKKIVLN